ncbi:MAG TPA: hypothetical protein VIO58_14295 [Candidatus Methanoperedens sp.]
MNKIGTKTILIALIIGLTAGAGFAIYSNKVTSQQATDYVTLGKHNITIQRAVGQNGEIITLIGAPAYGTQDFEAYKAERMSILKEAARKDPYKIAWATITFKGIRAGELGILKTKYSLKFLDISGSASNNLENDSDASGIGINAELVGENLELFSRIYYVSVKATLVDLDWIAGEPDVILVDLNTEHEIHGPPLVNRIES